MKFKRINVDTVRCLISEQELHDNGLDVEDFLRNDGKTEPFLRKIISMAEEEVGYKVQGGNISIQVAVLPEHVIALTFSERPEQGIANMLDNLRDAVRHLAESAGIASSRGDAEEPQTQGEDSEPENMEESLVLKDRNSYQIHFENLDAAVNYAKGVTLECEVSSSLYYSERAQAYYLVVEKGNMDARQVCRLLSAALDFSKQIYAHEPTRAYLMEHGKCVIADHAIEHLQEI